MDQCRARGITVDLYGLNLINQPLILDVSRLFTNSSCPGQKLGEVDENKSFN
jgi:hypothetical protein